MKLKNLFIAVLLVGLPLKAFSSTEDEDFMSYDAIVNELSSSSKSSLPGLPEGDSFDSILLHAGVGLATSYVFLSPKEGPRSYGFLKGFEANLGIDLFSRNWLAEGSLRSFGTEELRRDSYASLKEFDLKVVYQDALTGKMLFRLGGGMAARYLNYKFENDKGTQEQKFSTPATLISAGLKAQITSALSIGTELGYRSALVQDTIDDSAIDASLRLDARF
jgi:hypothetical protein